jgi:hypothetical protein
MQEYGYQKALKLNSQGYWPAINGRIKKLYNMPIWTFVFSIDSWIIFVDIAMLYTKYMHVLQKKPKTMLHSYYCVQSFDSIKENNNIEI